MQLPKRIEAKGIRVLTTKQLAEAYDTTTDRIKQNFRENRKRFIDGKHYISLTGGELKAFKNQVEQGDDQVGKNALVANRAAHLYLWTKRGALLHAKSLNTDKTWQVYEYLVDYYFESQENKPEPPAKAAPAARPSIRQVVDVPENPSILNAIQKIKDDLTCMNVLLDNCKMYVSEDEYRERRRNAENVVPILITDWTRLQALKPGIIQKQY